jgi:hypothetical protein
MTIWFPGKNESQLPLRWGGSSRRPVVIAVGRRMHMTLFVPARWTLLGSRSGERNQIFIPRRERDGRAAGRWRSGSQTHRAKLAAAAAALVGRHRRKDYTDRRTRTTRARTSPSPTTTTAALRRSRRTDGWGHGDVYRARPCICMRILARMLQARKHGKTYVRTPWATAPGLQRQDSLYAIASFWRYTHACARML